MTNEELDHWIAEKVMGWHFVSAGAAHPQAAWCIGDDRDDVIARLFYEWEPTVDIAQAIEAAEKALKDRRIERWFIGHSIDGMPNRGVEVLDGPVITDSRGEIDDAEFLCRALCIAMAGDS